MGEAALKIEHSHLSTEKFKLSAVIESRKKTLIPLLLVLISIQIADGALTLFGVHRYGHSIEANPLISYLFTQVSPIYSIILIKTLAIATSIWAWHLCSSISWLPNALKLTVLLYALAAIAPWSYILLG